MEDSNGFNIIPKAVDAAIQGVTDPPAKEIGKTFEDLIYLATGPIHFAADKRRAKYAAELEKFKNGLSQKVESIPPENLVEPELQVVGPALEDAKYCLESESIREMFENLLAKAADSRYQSKVHPSFSQIIKQMSPLDAENLKYINPQKVLPIAEYRLERRNPFGFIVVLPNVFLSNVNYIDSLVQQSQSIESLHRLGLIKTDYSNRIGNDEEYEPFEKTNFFLHFNANHDVYTNKALGIPGPDVSSTLSVVKGCVYLTTLGESFYEVCLK